MIFGSHNTMTYLKSTSWIYNIFSCFWRCQKLDIYKQFSKGVRCFDLRVRMHDENWVFAHGKSIFDSDADILSIIDTLNKISETCNSKVYIRLLLEINEHNSYQENSFISLCELLNEKYKNNDRIIIFECRRKYDWTQLYNFGVYPEVIQYVGSMQTKIYGKICPRLYYLFNKKKLNKIIDEINKGEINKDKINKDTNDNNKIFLFDFI